MDKGVPKAPDVFLHRSEHPVQVEVLNKHTHIVTLRVEPRDLVYSVDQKS